MGVPRDGLDSVAQAGTELVVAGLVAGAGLKVGTAAGFVVELFTDVLELVAVGTGEVGEGGGEEGQGRDEGGNVEEHF